MSKQALIISTILLFSLFKSYPQIKKGDKINLPKQLQKFIPKGYAVLDTTMGDLNLDKFADILLVLKTIGEENQSDTDITARPLLILIGHADKSFTLAGRNDDVVYCRGCGGIFGDPYDGIEIHRGTFTVNHFGGSNDRWSNEITFKYSKSDKKWYLSKIVDKAWNVSDPNKIDSTLVSGLQIGVSFENYRQISD